MHVFTFSALPNLGIDLDHLDVIFYRCFSMLLMFCTLN